MQIKFLGAAQMVTGSCHLVTVNKHRVLLDCGLIQGNREQEQQNLEPFHFNVSDIDAVVLSHAHLDHSGRLPILVKQGFRGPIYAQHATVDLCKILLEDAGYLNERSAEWENRKRERKALDLVQPLFTQVDAQITQKFFQGIEYGESIEVTPGFSVVLHDAGHILGSAIVEAKLTEGNNERTIVFTGDLGHRGAPILKNPTPIHCGDLVIMESTYGDRLHRDWDETWKEMGEVIQSARIDKGNILIPAFTVGRTQELLYVFGRHFQEWQLDQWEIFLDSPMAIKANHIYSKHAEIHNHQSRARFEHCGNPFDLPNLHLTESTEESMAINKLKSGAIVIAGSGMCNGGRIKHHLKHNLWRKDCHLIFVGFQARGTLGRTLVDGAVSLSLWGESIKVKARIHTIGGLSAHADQQGLLTWYQQFSGKPPVVLVHGEADAQESLSDRLTLETGADVKIAARGETLNLLNL
jgi:metallo-beta-lactamase family protein